MKRLALICIILIFNIFLVACGNRRYEDTISNLNEELIVLEALEEENNMLKLEIEELNDLLYQNTVNNELVSVPEGIELPSVEVVQDYLGRGVEIGDNFLLGGMLECDYSTYVEEADGSIYCPVIEEGVNTFKGLEDYILEVYTPEVKEFIFIINYRFKEIDGKLYCKLGDKGGPIDWFVELPKLIEYRRKDNVFIYEVRGVSRIDGGQGELKRIEIKYIRYEEYKLNTFMYSGY